MSQTKRVRIPNGMSLAIAQIRRDPIMRQGIEEMEERKSEFSTPLAAALAGIAANPIARAHFDDRLDEMWMPKDIVQTRTRSKSARASDFPEVVIGAGLHAAIYCAVRHAMGKPKPLVIEASPRVGGIFSVSRKPSFYLNSRNRPGELSVPGQPGGLNVLPGAVVQPCDLSGDEYQRNSDLALVIRATLAMYANVLTGVKVLELSPVGSVPSSSRVRIRVEGQTTTFCETKRVICATGLGNPNQLSTGNRIINYPAFMTLMDQPFPLSGMRRVAVVGAGDSGRTVVEALTGQGPSTGMSVASLDWVEQIDWYGTDETFTRARWEECNRSRYQGIARVLPLKAGGPARVTAIQQRATNVNDGFGCAYVNEIPYDAVINCTGFLINPIPNDAGILPETFPLNGRIVGTRVTGRDIYGVGPAAGLGVTDSERSYLPQVTAIKENSTSIFRYAGRTAALAASFA